MSASNCEICHEFTGSAVPDHYLIRGVPEDGRVVARTADFVVVPDYAPLLAGHLLLFASQHALSVADYLAQSPKRLDELVWIFDVYLARYDRITVIEHGSTTEVEVEQPCVAHAHVHLLPLDVHDLQDAFIKDAMGIPEVIEWPDVAARATGEEYVLVGDRDFVALAARWKPPSRQYARSLVGKVMGLSRRRTYSDTCLAPEIVASTLAEWS